MATPVYTAIIVVTGISLCLFALLYFLILLNKNWDLQIKKRIFNALQIRQNLNDSFRETHGYSWDYVIVFKVYDEDEEISDEQAKFSMKYVLHRLTLGGLDFKLFYSFQRKHVFCKIRASPDSLLKEADRIDLLFLTDEVKLEQLCSKGRVKDGKLLWKPLSIPTSSEQTSIPPYAFIHIKAEYDENIHALRSDIAAVLKLYPVYIHRQNFKMSEHSFVVDSPMQHRSVDDDDAIKKGDLLEPDVQYSIFRSVDRLKLIHSIITSPTSCHLDIHKLMKHNCILGYFPLHDYADLGRLEKKWILYFQLPWNQAVDEVKDYFGEKIGLYFGWLGFYTSFLFPAAVFGFITWAFVTAENNDPNAAVVPYFAGFMAFWTAMFLEFWKRQEKFYAMRWGMVGFESTEQVRPQFVGAEIRSPIDGKPYVFFSKLERFKRSLRSNFAICGSLVVVVATIASIFTLRLALNASTINGQPVGAVVSSIILALQIQICNSIYGKFALSLNDHENYRTDTEYEDALISKTFTFQFVNSFAPLFYIAFIKPFIPTIDSCTLDSCLLELQTTLGTIFLTRLVIGTFTELGIPLAMSAKQAKGLNKEYLIAKSYNVVQGLSSSQELPDISEIEQTFILPSYDVLLGSFDDYAEIVIQFGYSTMFVAAFPLATVMSLITNYVELRVDAWKICRLTKRPEPKSCEDIGTWYIVLEITSVFAVFINSGIVAFTGNALVNYTWTIRIWIFFLMSSALIGIRFLVAYLVPDIPREVDIQLARQDYITNKVLHNVEDEEDDAAPKLKNIPLYSVLPTDDDPR